MFGMSEVVIIVNRHKSNENPTKAKRLIKLKKVTAITGGYL
jgi:hypothetical protein